MLLISKFLFLIILCSSLNQNTNTKIKAVIYDLDGTLIDSQHLYDEANQYIIDKYGNGEPYDDELKLQIHGSSPAYGSRFIINHFRINLTYEEFSEMKDNYVSTRRSQVKPMEGVTELTHLFKHKYGLKSAIATSSFKRSVYGKIAHLKEWIESDFDKIIYGDDKRVKKGKPSPDIFLLAAEELGVRPEECIIFEDAVNGVQAALSSGASVVVGLPDSNAKNMMENLPYDKTKTKLYILDSFKNFDYSLIK